MKNKIIIFLVLASFNGFGQITRTLPNVTNTADSMKPVSTIQKAAIVQKLQTVSTISALQGFTDATICQFDGSTWNKISGNVASNGGAFAGTIINVNASFYWNRIVEKYVTFEMFGAKGDGVTDDYIAISNTFLNATNVFVSPKTFICSQAITQIQSNSTIIGLGKKSEIRFTYIGENHFVAIQNKQNILIDNIYFNANMIGRLTGGVTAQQGATVIFYNSEISNTPRLNNITIQNCFIGSNGFNGIAGINSHAINCFNNYFYQGRDSGIAATSGCSQWNIARNHFEDTNQFPISLSNNGVTASDYNNVGMVRNCIVQSNFINVSASSGYGIELDGVDGIKIFDNIITVNQNVTYGIRLISSNVFANVFDVYNVDIKNNTIINKSTSNRVGIEVFNSGTSSPDNNITITGNTITNQIESTLKGISIVNATVKCSKNIINSTVGKYSTGVSLEVYGVNNGIEIALIENEITGGVIGVQTTNLTNQAKLFITKNKIKGHTVATLGLNTGWNAVFEGNNLTGDIYNSGLTTKGDFRYYTAAPTTGTWVINEMVYNATPASGGYTGFICITAGTPGVWKGFGLIQ